MAASRAATTEAGRHPCHPSGDRSSKEALAHVAGELLTAHLGVGSLRHQLPRGLTLVALAAPVPTLGIDLVWPVDRTTPAVRRLIAVADQVAHSRGWLPVSSDH